MANRFGIEFDTISEIEVEQQQANQQLQQQALQSRDPNQVARASMAQAGQALAIGIVGDKRKKKAAAIEQIMGRAAELQRKDGEGEFDYQARQAEFLRENLAEVDAAAALQANDQIRQIRNDQLAQESLGLGNESKRQSIKEKAREAQLGAQRIIYEESGGRLIPRKVIPAKLTDQEAMDMLKAEQIAQPKAKLDIGSGLDMLELEGANGTSGSGSGKLTGVVNKRISGLEAGIQFNLGARNLLNGMEEQVGALALGGDLATEAASAISAGDRMVQLFYGDEDEFTTNVFVREDNERMLRVMNDLNVSGVAKGRIKALAYSLAKSLDPGGRLSDQDVEMAIEMLTGKGTPESLKKLLEERLQLVAENVKTTQGLIGERQQGFDSPTFRTLSARFDETFDEGMQAILDYQKAIDIGMGRIDPDTGEKVEQVGDAPDRRDPTRVPTSRFNPATGKMERI